MNNYLIESSVCMAAFYVFYWLFLRREKLLNINRFYLLASVTISLLVPLLEFKTPWAILPSESSSPFTLSESAIQSSETIYTISTLAIIYFSGVMVFIALLIFKLVSAKKKLGKHFGLRKNHIDIVEIEGRNAYSFLNTIFIGKELNNQPHLKEQIIAHEFAHINAKHSLDTLFFELIKCFYWFNPFSYFYSQSVQLQHEYIADHYALKKSDSNVYRRSLLQFTLSKIDYGLVSGFGQHPVQKRLKMLQTINSNIMKRLKPLFALPVLALLVIAFACTEEDIDPLSELNLVEEQEIPMTSNVEPETLKGIVIELGVRIDSVRGYQEAEVPITTLEFGEIHEQPIEGNSTEMEFGQNLKSIAGKVIEVREVLMKETHQN